MEIELEARRRIYRAIKRSPGIHFRELLKRLGIVVGELQYHLDWLVRKGIIRMERDEGFTRYFPKDFVLDEQDREIMRHLWRRTTRKIIIWLLQNPCSTLTEISKAINRSPSTTSWHLDKLVRAGLVVRRKERTTFFTIREPERVVRLLILYRESFLDRIVDSFIEVWEEENPSAETGIHGKNRREHDA